jgi:hypothetical protein
MRPRAAARPAARAAVFAAVFVAIFVAILAAAAGPAFGYDPATTHAGLTERAVVASSLHRVLVHRLSRPLGLFEPVPLRLSDLPEAERNALVARLGALDPGGGYAPGPDGSASALAWVIAGSVIAQIPAERGQNFFYDPSRGAGLTDAGGLAPIGQGLRQLIDQGDGGFRGLATGTNFNMTGIPSTAWLTSDRNDVGLPVYYAELEAAVAGAEPGARATALARALLALGGTLAVLEDAGEPAHVRNDFRGAYLGAGGASPFDRGSPFERFVAERYGRMGVPAAAHPVSRPTVMAYITGADGQGLADRTQRRFFSDGSLPVDPVVDRASTPAEVMRDARESLPYGLPRLPHLALAAMGRRSYAYAPAEASDADKPSGKGRGRRLLGYQRVPGRVHFFLDDAVYADTARALLPEIGGYGAGLIDLLFRGELRLEAEDGQVKVALAGAHGDVSGGQVRLYAEDAAGKRRPFAAVDASADGVSVAIPDGARRIAAVLRARDDAGELVAVAETPVR